jgi:hypothetical protein
MDNEEKIWNIAINTPVYNRVYCYLSLNKDVDSKLGIIDSFNTFQEIASDLQLFKKSLWDLSWKPTSHEGWITYAIKGNGFLTKVQQ